jgi:hypothetical protein
LYKDEPEKLKELQEVSETEAEARIQYLLHEKGYTFFNGGALTYPEVSVLINGNILANEEVKANMPKAKR